MGETSIKPEGPVPELVEDTDTIMKVTTRRKTAYEIESELKGSAVDRTGFGGRPELINFYMEDGDVAALPVFDKLDVDALCCGKTVPVLTVLNGHGSSKTNVCGVEITKAEGVVTKIKFIASSELSVTFTVASGEWAIDSAGGPPLNPSA